MVNTLRRFSQPIMLFIAVGVIVSFAFFGPGGCNDGRGQGGKNALFEIYGKKIQLEDQERLKNKLEVFGALGCGYYEALATGDRGNPYLPQPEDEYDFSFVNAMVFEHEADAMGIGASDAEIAAELEKIPGFQIAGKFDVAAFDRMIERGFQPNGFSKDNVETFLIGSIRMRKVQELVKSSAFVTADEVRNSVMDRNQITEASFATLKKADFLAGITIPDDELAKRYEEKKDQLKTDELRKVRFVSFLLPPADPAKTLTDSEKTKLLQTSVNAAYDFAQAILKKGRKFDELAAEQKLAIAETAPFIKDEVPDALEGKEKDVADDIAEAVFALKKESPVSQHLIGKKGAYVVVLPEDGITEPKQKTLEETKAMLTTQMQGEKADEAVRKKGEELQKKIAEAKKAGKSFTEACEAAGLKSEAFPAYSQTKPAQGANFNVIRTAAAKLAPGEVSDFVATPEGGIIVHLDQRPVVDDKALEAEKAATLAALERNRGMSIFREWLKERRRASGIPAPAAAPEDKKG